MAAYALPRRYRRGRYLRRRGGSPAVPVVIALAVLAAGASAKAVVSHAHGKAAPLAAAAGNRAAAQVTAFAAARVGNVPYLWGGTTDAGMDCSGLAQAAYASAGIAIERTSQDQWASERHVTVPVSGDLVFFAGSDGTPTSPGHVGIVTDPARHQMIDAYASGTYVREEGYGPAASPGTGLGSVVGFTDPAPGSSGAAPGLGEAGFINAVLADLGAPATAANISSLAAWGSREGCWGCVGANNQFDSTLYEPGATAFNTFGGGLHVWNYPSAAVGAQATAATIGGYPLITAALRSGSGACGNGFAAEFSMWSAGGYTEVC